MLFLFAAIIVVTWGAMGFAIAVVAGTELAPLFGVRNMEGYPAMLAFVSVAPLGGFAGLVAGLWVARHYWNNHRKLAIAALAPLGAATSLALVALIQDGMSRPTPKHIYGMITVELRLPAGTPPAAMPDVLAELRHDKPDQTIKLSFYDGDWIRRRDGDRVVVQGLVDTWIRATNRTIAFRVGDGPLHLFRLDLPLDLADSKFSAWQPADTIQQAGSPPRTAKSGEDIDIRYSVNQKY